MANVDQQTSCESGPRESLAAVMKRGRQQRQGPETAQGTDLQQGAEEGAVIALVSSLTLGPSPLVGLLYNEAMLQHECTWDAANPECPGRLSMSYERCQNYNLVDRCVLLQSRNATEAEILTKHTKDYFELMKTTESMSEEDLKEVSARYDGMYFNPRSFQCALLAAGSSIEMVENIVHGKIKCGMALVRPPGHHASRQTSCGYCIFNNVAIAAQHALDQLGLSRVLIVDWDVHHGQATQQMFYHDPRVLYFSIHRYEFGEFWPNLRESDYDAVGEGAARGYNINVPLNETELTNDDYLAIIQQVLLPVAYQFSPELVIVSSGYDAAIGDIEGECVLSPAFYAHLVHMLKPLAGGRMCVILEGGYCKRVLAESVALTLRSLLDDPCPLLERVQPARSSVTDVILHTLRVLRPYWSTLCYQDDADDSNLPSLFTDIEIPKKGVKFDEGDIKEYDIIGYYPIQTPEKVSQYDLSICRLIRETDLMVPPNRTCVAYDEQMRRHKCHTIPSHPERPDRVSSIYKMFEEEGMVQRCKLLQSRAATTVELSLVHCKSYIEEVRSYQTTPQEDLVELEQRHNSLYLSQESFECACLATGCVLNIVDEVMQGQSQNGLAIVRPPGHHAEASKGMGFCFFNSIAIAAMYAIKTYALDRILVLDWDVHHGNGTQKAFYDNPNVLFISLHRYNWGTFFPNGQSGCHESVGTGEGAGYNVNIPWNAPVGQLGDTEYMAAFQQIVMPIVYEFAPQLVLVSAGFDAAKGDPLGGCRVTAACFGHMTQMLQSLANGRLILVLEGGYNLIVTAESMTSCASVMLGDVCQSMQMANAPCHSAVDTIASVLDTQQAYWKTLQYRVRMPKREDMRQALEDTQTAECVTHIETPSEVVSDDALTAAMSGLTVFVQVKEFVDTMTCHDDDDKMHLAAGDSGSDTVRVCEGVTESESDTVGECAGGDITSQDNNSNNIVTGPEGDGGVEDQREMFAVMPLTWCPHLVEVQPLPEDGIDASQRCDECWHIGENWLCLTCYTVHCSRYVNSHMLQHTTANSHNIVLSYADMSAWCYGCDHYVHNAVLIPAKRAAHISKFGVAPGV